ncbi:MULTISPECIES: hypothetical protein [Bradyrhizobium]|uniref:hypothetical protein n=1 Tax=Bradyrhizobium TaxID=374 RepID=UPI0012BCD5D6|nr:MULTISPECIES: hypothetical protein [Bradyrhizobium]MBR1000518.1 hypothetical protein [Bradyrhizobium liaoningense]MCP1863704.1 hypothetical protein [Bradyrhizobium japonicum]MCW2327675.1 hypothetical protein [Bradyrhizobium japonicum]WLB98561.1 hypothetical protein QIH92_03365 [Bradyrhizobium japonicum USDA 123]
MSDGRVNTSSDEEWEPIFDVPDNLRRDGSNYVEWIWSLLDDGIEVPLSGSFTDLRTAAGEPLLDAGVAADLDEQMTLARRAAAGVNHDLQDVLTCCRADGLDAGPLADELSRQFFLDSEATLSRAKAIGEICDMAEEFCKEALYLKADLARDPQLPMALRRAVDPDISQS